MHEMQQRNYQRPTSANCQLDKRSKLVGPGTQSASTLLASKAGSDVFTKSLLCLPAAGAETIIHDALPCRNAGQVNVATGYEYHRSSGVVAADLEDVCLLHLLSDR